MEKAFLNHIKGIPEIKELDLIDEDSVILDAEKLEDSNKSASLSSSILNLFKTMSPQALRYAIIYSLAEYLTSHDIIRDIRTPEDLRTAAKTIIRNSSKRNNKGLYKILTAYESLEDALKDVEKFSDNCCDLFSEDKDKYLPIIGQYLRVLNTKALYLKKDVELARTFSATVGLQDDRIIGSNHLVNTRGFYLLSEILREDQQGPKDVDCFYADTRTMELIIYTILEEENLLKELLLNINYCSIVEVESILSEIPKFEKSILQLMLLDIFCGGEISADFEIPSIAKRVTKINSDYFNKYLPYNYCTTSQLRPLMVSKALSLLDIEDTIDAYEKVESMIDTYVSNLKSENTYSQLNNYYSVLDEDYLVMSLRNSNPKIFDSEEVRLNKLHRIPMGYLELNRYQALATKYPSSLYHSNDKVESHYLRTHFKTPGQEDKGMSSYFSYSSGIFRESFVDQAIEPEVQGRGKDTCNTKDLMDRVVKLISSFEFKMECMRDFVLSYDTNDVDAEHTKNQFNDLEYYHSILYKYNLMF